MCLQIQKNDKPSVTRGKVDQVTFIEINVECLHFLGVMPMGFRLKGTGTLAAVRTGWQHSLLKSRFHGTILQPYDIN